MPHIIVRGKAHNKDVGVRILSKLFGFNCCLGHLFNQFISEQRARKSSIQSGTGFRRSLAAAYLVLSAGYFLLGSLSAGWMAPIRNSLPLYWMVFAILMVPALGPSIVKPVVAGTTARASTENVRSLGYSIYYTVVNIGGTLGPADQFIRHSGGAGSAYRSAKLSGTVSTKSRPLP